MLNTGLRFGQSHPELFPTASMGTGALSAGEGDRLVWGLAVYPEVAGTEQTWWFMQIDGFSGCPYFPLSLTERTAQTVGVTVDVVHQVGGSPLHGGEGIVGTTVKPAGCIATLSTGLHFGQSQYLGGHALAPFSTFTYRNDSASS